MATSNPEIRMAARNFMNPIITRDQRLPKATIMALPDAPANHEFLGNGHDPNWDLRYRRKDMMMCKPHATLERSVEQIAEQGLFGLCAPARS
jgi:hypothetical protein